MADKNEIKEINLETIDTKPKVAPKMESPFEKRFIKGGDRTVYLVLDGKRRAFHSWQQLADTFGIVPQYDEEHVGGVVRLAQDEFEVIPEGEPFA